MLYFSGAGIIKGVYLNLAVIERSVEFKSCSKISEDEWAETCARLESMHSYLDCGTSRGAHDEHASHSSNQGSLQYP